MIGAAAGNQLPMVEFNDRIEDRTEEGQGSVMNLACDFRHASEVGRKADLRLRACLGKAVELVIEKEVPLVLRSRRSMAESKCRNEIKDMLSDMASENGKKSASRERVSGSPVCESVMR